jgi:hypothetical protein
MFCITFGGLSIRMVMKLTFWLKNVKTKKQQSGSSKVTKRPASLANQDNHW